MFPQEQNNVGFRELRIANIRTVAIMMFSCHHCRISKRKWMMLVLVIRWCIWIGKISISSRSIMVDRRVGCFLTSDPRVQHSLPREDPKAILMQSHSITHFKVSNQLFAIDDKAGGNLPKSMVLCKAMLYNPHIFSFLFLSCQIISDPQTTTPCTPTAFNHICNPLARPSYQVISGTRPKPKPKPPLPAL